jgi:hypothetical protein
VIVHANNRMARRTVDIDPEVKLMKGMRAPLESERNSILVGDTADPLEAMESLNGSSQARSQAHRKRQRRHAA